MEAETRTLKLPGCNKDTLELFLYYATNKTLPDFVMPINAQAEMEEGLAISLGFELRLIRLWSFGDAFLVPKVQNEAMLRFLRIRMSCGGVHSSVVALAFEVAAPDSQLCQAMVAMTVHGWIWGSRSPKTPERMQRLSEIPGFFDLFATLLKRRYTEDGQTESCRWTAGFLEKYMVDEEPAKNV